MVWTCGWGHWRAPKIEEVNESKRESGERPLFHSEAYGQYWLVNGTPFLSRGENADGTLRSRPHRP